MRSQLRSIAGDAGNNVWAVGTYQTSAGGLTQYDSENLLLRQDTLGNWTQFTVPSPDNQGDLWDITAPAPNNVWAVGVCGTAARPQLWHYTGAGWTFQTALPTHTTAYLFGVKALSANDIWAVGGNSNDDSIVVGAPSFEGYAVHFDGTSWQEFQTPWVGNRRHGLNDVDGVASNDVWAVGSWGSSPDPGRYIPWIVHWDGTSWTTSPLPTTVTDNLGEILSVRAISANNVWAVGYYLAGGMATLHWDGIAWSEVMPTSAGGAFAFINSTEGYSVGGTIKEWNGTQWVLTDSLNYLPYASLAAATALPNGEVWAVGRTVDNNVFRTLVMRHGMGGLQARATAQPGIIQPGGSTQLGINLLQPGQYSYKWMPGATLSDSTAASPIARPLTTTDYTVTATDSRGNSLQRIITIQVAGPMAIQDRAADRVVTVHPNPFRNVVHIKLSFLNGAFAQLVLTDALGKTVAAQHSRLGSGEATLSIPDVRPGLYFLTVKTASGAVQRLRLVQE